MLLIHRTRLIWYFNEPQAESGLASDSGAAGESELWIYGQRTFRIRVDKK